MAKNEKLNDMVSSLLRVFRRFRHLISPHRKLIAGACLALLGEIVFRILEPWPLKFVFDRIIPNSPANGLSGIAWIDSADPLTLLLGASLLLVVFVGLRALASFSNTVGFALVGNRVLTDVRSELYSHLQHLSMSFHNRSRNGDLVLRVISDIGLLKEVTVTAMLPLMTNVLMLFGMVGIMFWVHWKLTLLALSIFPLFLLTASRLGNRIREVSNQQRRRESAMAAAAAESMSSIKMVQAMSLENVFGNKFSSANKKSMKDGVKAKRLAANLERTVDLQIAVATSLVLFYGTWLVMQATLTPGDLLVFLAYLKSAFKPVRNFAKYTARLAKASAAGDRVLEILESVPEVRNHAHAIDAPVLQGAVSFKDVAFAYDDGTSVLRKINLDIRVGEQIALVGSSGAGKSTLVNMLMRFYDPTAGSIEIDDQDIRNFTLQSLRSQISTVLQEDMLFAASVHTNIAYGAAESSDQEVYAAACLANADHFIQKMPEGYQTNIAERGVSLSKGQRQRIAIARAAIRKAPILILDEPTTGLDKRNEVEVIDALENLSKGKTTFWILHNMKMAARTDRILFLENGGIVEQGSHSELMRLNGRYASLYRLQAGTQTMHLHEEKLHAVVS